MKLTDLDPRYASSVDREKIGITFKCPCGNEKDIIFVPFKNPPDGDEPIREVNWTVSGDSFDNLTLTPSIQRNSDCRWHGYVTNGEIITA